MIIILNYINTSLPKISVIAMGLGKIGLILNWARRFYRIFDSSVWTPVATVGVSWLKIKPVVLIFPVIESTSVDSVTHTTVKILWGEDSLLYTVLFYFRFLTSILMIETKAKDASKPADFIAKSTVKCLFCFHTKKV